jgi:hypothetical protein
MSLVTSPGIGVMTPADQLKPLPPAPPGMRNSTLYNRDDIPVAKVQLPICPEGAEIVYGGKKYRQGGASDSFYAIGEFYEVE